MREEKCCEKCHGYYVEPKHEYFPLCNNHDCPCHTPPEEHKEGCNCKEMSCKVGCTRRHTHKGFSCQICKPPHKEGFCNWCSAGGSGAREDCPHHSPQEEKSKKCGHGRYFNGNGNELPCPICHQDRRCWCGNVFGKCPFHQEEKTTLKLNEFEIETAGGKQTFYLKEEVDHFLSQVKTTTESWEMEFDRRFGKEMNKEDEKQQSPWWKGFKLVAYRSILLKSFIRQLLARDHQKVVKMVSGMKVTVQGDEYTGPNPTDQAYNQALDDLLSKLKEL